MKLKLVVVDLELSRRQKRFGALGLAAAAALSATVAFAAPQAFTQGETLTAAKLNANFDDLDERLSAVEQTTTMVVARGQAPLSVPNGTFVKAVFNQESIDALNEYDPTTGVFTPMVSGNYMVCASIRMSAKSEIDLYVNGVRTDALGLTSVNVGGGCTGTRLSAGDSLDLRVYQDSGATAAGTSDVFWSRVSISRT